MMVTMKILLLCTLMGAAFHCGCGLQSPLPPAAADNGQLLRALRLTRFGPVLLEALPLSPGVWVTVGHVSLLRRRRSRRVFRPSVLRAGFSATLQLGSRADFQALARAATWAAASGDGPVTECQFVRPQLTALACSTAVRLPEGFELQLSGSASQADLRAAGGDATVAVHFNSLGGAWTEAALADLEANGELTCRLTTEQFSTTVRLRSSEALDPQKLDAEPPARCRQHQSPTELLAVYNFASEQPTENLVARGRYNVSVRGGVLFGKEGATLPGNSWLEIDTEGGLLTEHMKFGSQWSVFFAFRRPTQAPATMRGSSLFSVHRAGNPLACSILAWTSGRDEASVYGRVHNLAAGYAIGERTLPVLNARPGAWNLVGVSFDGRRQTITINGAAARLEASYRLPSYSSSSADGLRDALSVGLVRAPSRAMRGGAFGCFGVARGYLRPDEFGGLFDKHCRRRE